MSLQLLGMRWNWPRCRKAMLLVFGVVDLWLAVQQIAMLRGAKKVYAMDRDSQRLRLAEDFGMTPVDMSLHQEVGEYLLSIQEEGLDRAIEASEFRSVQKPLHTAMRAIGLERDSGDTLEDIIKATQGWQCCIG
jgi:threonine dehydrogenase-like Zn-dependent dehydrogenase